MGKKTSEDVTTKQVDPAVATESSALVNLFRGMASQEYQPNRGVTVADFSPAQKASFASTDAAASAFGAPVAGGTGLPQAERSASGIMGFKPSKEFDASVAALSPEFVNARKDFRKDIGKTTPYKQFEPDQDGGKK